jgi:hypothetical protein
VVVDSSDSLVRVAVGVRRLGAPRLAHYFWKEIFRSTVHATIRGDSVGFPTRPHRVQTAMDLQTDVPVSAAACAIPPSRLEQMLKVAAYV